MASEQNDASVREGGALPTGTVTFLFTDIEGSTRLVERLGEEYASLLAIHDSLIESAVSGFDGVGLGTEGDSHFAVFADATDAVGSAVSMQEALADQDWPEEVAVRIRIGLHTGEGVLGGANYVGLDVHRAARISDAAHGGQTVVSEATALAVERHLGTDIHLIDLGKHRLKDLSDPVTIFQIWAPGLEREFPALRTLDAIPNNLPVQLSSFIGREEVLADAIRLLGSSRILTMTGTGGTGKTRLSLQVAAEVSAHYPDGVFFVGLSPLSDPTLVTSAIMSALGIRAPGGSVSQGDHLVAQLSGKSVLLVLDNFEHVLEARTIVTAILQGSPRTRILVTSRAPLRVAGEQELPVPPLGLVPRAKTAASSAELVEFESVRLFVERAKSVRPDFELNADNSGAVVALVNRLDGLPLAIELVASRIRLLSVEAILDRLDSRLLASGAMDLPERQRTIEAAVDWSYDLLDPAAQKLFAVFSVFAGGARFDEIERVVSGVSEIPDLFGALETLVDQSLLMSGDGVAGPRFRMLHVIREIAMTRLDDSDDADKSRQMHLEAYTVYVEETASKLLGRDRGMWLDALEEDHDNIRAALEWGMGNDVDLALRLAAATWRYWQARGHLNEAAQKVEQVLELPGGEPLHRLKAVEALGGIQWWQGDIETCLGTYQQLLAMAKEIDDAREIANGLYNVALAQSFATGDFHATLPLLDEGEAIYRELGDVNGLGDIYWARGDGAQILGDADYTVENMTKAADYYRESGNEFGRGWAEFNISAALIRSDRVEQGWPHLVSALELFASHRDLSAITLFLANAAHGALNVGERSRALRILGALHTVRIASGADIVTVDSNLIPGYEQDTLEALTGEDARIYAEGKALTTDEAIAYVLDWSPGE